VAELDVRPMTAEDEAELRRLIVSYWIRVQKCTTAYVTSSCQGKSKFQSQTQARQSSLFRRDVHARLQPYRCVFCGFWHIGARKPGEKKIQVLRAREDRRR
jgi:hypothetical protein